MSGSDDDDFFGDTIYEVWRRGGNPDNVDRDRVNQYFDMDLGYEEAARSELEKQHFFNPTEEIS
jgi:hypothetical protein